MSSVRILRGSVDVTAGPVNLGIPHTLRATVTNTDPALPQWHPQLSARIVR